ncbi:hypothetical protein A0U90_11015 [Kozakia baliensis]|nr:hypothetical protein A0U90_11015 [Kozakia baliensis]
MVYKRLAFATKKMFPNAVEANSGGAKHISISIDTMAQTLDGNSGFGRYRVDLGTQLAGTVTASDGSIIKHLDVLGTSVVTKHDTNCGSLKDQVVETANLAAARLSRDYVEKLSSFEKQPQP